LGPKILGLWPKGWTEHWLGRHCGRLHCGYQAPLLGLGFLEYLICGDSLGRRVSVNWEEVRSWLFGHCSPNCLESPKNQSALRMNPQRICRGLFWYRAETRRLTTNAKKCWITFVNARHHPAPAHFHVTLNTPMGTSEAYLFIE